MKHSIITQPRSSLMESSKHWSRKKIRWKSSAFLLFPFPSSENISRCVTDFLAYNVESRERRSRTNAWQNEEERRVKLNIFLWRKKKRFGQNRAYEMEYFSRAFF